ncbi:MAG: hypothetical protein JNM93_10660 [Bacteriovoracaceae bacterium]|nr:hypothetical protein [Bacteriovoracaceae bacterium]
MHSIVDVEKIKKTTTESITKMFPRLELTVEQLDYKLASSLKFSGNNLALKLKKRPQDGSSETLLLIESFELRIPLLSLITNGGNLKFLAKNAIINYEEYESANNWKYAFKEVNYQKEVDVLSFLTNSKLNFNFKNSKLRFKLKNQKNGEYDLTKIIVRDFKLSSSSAFEIETALNYELAPDKKIDSKLLIIGEIDLKKYIDESIIQASLITTLSDFSYSELASKIPKIKNKINFTLNSDQSLFFDFNLDIDSLLNIESKGNLENNKIRLSDIKSEVSLTHLKTLLPQRVNDSLHNFDFLDSKLQIAGKLNIDRQTKAIETNLDLLTTKKFNLILPLGMNFSTLLKGNLTSDKLQFTLVSELFGGTMTVETTTKLSNDNFDFKIERFNTLVRASGIKLDNFNFGHVLNSTSSEPDKKSKNDSKFIPGELELAFEQFYINNQELKLNGKIQVSPDQVLAEKVSVFIGSDAQAQLYYKQTISENKLINTKSVVTLNRCDMKELAIITPSALSGVAGKVTGKITTDILRHNERRIENRVFDLKLVDGNLTFFDSNTYITNLVAHNAFFKSSTNDTVLVEEFKKMNTEFKDFSVQAKLENDLLTINQFAFREKNGNYSLKGNGKIYLLENIDNASTVLFDLNMQNKVVGAKLLEVAGSSQIPVKLKGTATNLAPDLDYTIETLINQSLKERSKKYFKSETLKELFDGKRIIINPGLLKSI